MVMMFRALPEPSHFGLVISPNTTGLGRVEGIDVQEVHDMIPPQTYLAIATELRKARYQHLDAIRDGFIFMFQIHGYFYATP